MIPTIDEWNQTPIVSVNRVIFSHSIGFNNYKVTEILTGVSHDSIFD